MNRAPLSVAVLISGNGSNLQAIIDACTQGTINARVCCVISNQAGAYGLERARRAGVPAHTLRHVDFVDRAAFDTALAELIDAYEPDLVVLAGFMRILGADFVSRYRHRVINIHPSLLPRHKGLDTHTRALAEGDTHHGATVHIVTPDLDSGPIIVQQAFRIEQGDSAQSLEDKVHRIEHQILPQAIGWFADDRLKVGPDGVTLDGAAVRPAECT